jgi:two-component system CheB/CheR fusion protein
LERILSALRDNDEAFDGYHPTFLGELVEGRMRELALVNGDAYRALWLADPREQRALREALPVVHSGFFRDPPFWEHVQEQILPQLLARLAHEPRINLWIAGCARGEELYTLALLLAERLDRLTAMNRIRLFGTDASWDAIARAREGSYTPEQLEAVPGRLRERYFHYDGAQFTVRDEIKRSAVFSRHDLLRDSPISKLDFISCRNTLIYFRPDVQRRLHIALHYSLRDGARLALGPSDSLPDGTDPPFECESTSQRVFRKRPASGVHPWLRSGCSVLQPTWHRVS